MREVKILSGLIIALKEAALAERWQQVYTVDKQIATTLSRIDMNSLDKEDQQRIRQFHQAYGQILQHCGKAQALLQKKMVALRQNQEGIAAYNTFIDLA